MTTDNQTMALTEAPSTAMAIANWFINRGLNDPNKPKIDQMKLYKLVYYSHGWFIGNTSCPLFAEDIEAWPHGPVVRDLYIEFKDAGRGPISKLGSRLEQTAQGFVKKTPVHDGTYDSFLESIWQSYGQHTGIHLSNATHAPGEPWSIVAQHYDLSQKPTIPNELIFKVFAGKVAQKTL